MASQRHDGDLGIVGAVEADARFDVLKTKTVVERERRLVVGKAVQPEVSEAVSLRGDHKVVK